MEIKEVIRYIAEDGRTYESREAAEKANILRKKRELFNKMKIAFIENSPPFFHHKGHSPILTHRLKLSSTFEEILEKACLSDEKETILHRIVESFEKIKENYEKQ